MGRPSHKDIYGTLKYNDKVYNLYTKEQEQKIIEFMKKNNIRVLPIYPDLPRNVFTNYIVIDNKLYIWGISFGGVLWSKDFSSKDIFGKEFEECNFDITLKAVTKSISFIMNRKNYHKQWLKNFYFKNGELDKIKEDLKYNIDIGRIIKFYIDEDRNFIGLFWIIDGKIYSAKQLLDNVIEQNEFIKFPLPFNEIFKLFTKEYREYIDIKKLVKGSVAYDKNSKKYIITANKETDIDLIVKEFEIRHEKKEVFFNTEIK